MHNTSHAHRGASDPSRHPTKVGAGVDANRATREINDRRAFASGTSNHTDRAGRSMTLATCAPRPVRSDRRGARPLLFATLGDAAFTPSNLFPLVALSLLVTAVWDYLVHRPIMRAQPRDRLQTLSARIPGDAGDGTQGGDRDTSALDRLVIGRQKHIAAYTRRLRRELERYRAIYKHCTMQ